MSLSSNFASAENHFDYIGSKLGMWFFLFTEIILFGGLFLLYAVYRYTYPAEFHEAGKHLQVALGFANTLVLLTSSLTAALAVSALQKGKKYASMWYICTTVALAAVFMINKFLEWTSHISAGMYPGSPLLVAKGHGENLFYGLYYAMTGLHGVHVLAGAGALSLVYYWILQGKVDENRYVALENAVLFWHLVDLIWIYLFPLFYLII